MPSIEFYITDEERMDLFEFVQSNNGIFIPNLDYTSANAVTVSNKEEFISYIDNIHTYFFIVAPSFQLEPIRLTQYDEDKGLYMIQQRYGGPAIDISCYLGYADDAAIKQKSTMLSHYARYIHDESYEEFKASDELKEYYNSMVKFLKSKCKRVTASNGRKYWVSKSVLENLTL